MSRIVFVPLTDEMVFERPELIAGPITTYQPAVLNIGHETDDITKSRQVSPAYLKGDLLSGFEVVYLSDQPRKRINAIKYRDIKRGI